MGILMITLTRGNRKANRVWGLLLILFGFSILPVVLITSGYITYAPHLYMTGHPLVLLFGPLMMLYTRYITYGDYKPGLKFTLHFLPFIIYIIPLSPIYLLPAESKLEIIRTDSDDEMIIELIVSIFIVAHVFIYLLLSQKVLNNYEEKVKNSYSSLDKINLRWLRHSIYGMALIFAIMMTLILISFGGGQSVWGIYLQLIIPILVATVLFYDTYKTIHQPEIFIGKDEQEGGKRYEKSSLTDDKAQSYQEKLLEFMESEKPYRESNLTIKDLSSKVKIPSYHISQIINEKLNQNFFDFINRYRIEDVKRMLSDKHYESYSILAIAYEAGFNSKSVFNTSFKKYMKMTPSEYRKTIA